MTAIPALLTVRPNHGGNVVNDPLSEVLRAVRLIGGVFLDARFAAPWGVISKISPEQWRPYLEMPGQVISYHVVLEGRLLIIIDGQPPLEVSAGEIVLLPRNDTHVLTSAVGIRPVNAHALLKPSDDGGLMRIVYGGTGELTRVVCGFLASELHYNPLIATLPKILKLDIREGASRDWIEASVRFAADELVRGGIASSGVMSRLSELLLVEAVRNYASSLSEEETGWLKGVTDLHIGRALALLHGDISRDWSADELAKAVALSRSAFMERFTTLIGMPPIRYLKTWRLQTARLQLRETAVTIGQLAHAVGYESEEAFSRAFKREFGLAPARWRESELAK
jgi:AraC-like DNA-binding protein